MKMCLCNEFQFKARKTDRKLNRVALLVSVKDVKMTDLETGNVNFDISIYRFVFFITNCMVCFEVFRGVQYTINLYIHFKLDLSINDLIKS